MRIVCGSGGAPFCLSASKSRCKPIAQSGRPQSAAANAVCRAKCLRVTSAMLSVRHRSSLESRGESPSETQKVPRSRSAHRPIVHRVDGPRFPLRPERGEGRELRRGSLVNANRYANGVAIFTNDGGAARRARDDRGFLPASLSGCAAGRGNPGGIPLRSHVGPGAGGSPTGPRHGRSGGPPEKRPDKCHGVLANGGYHTVPEPWRAGRRQEVPLVSFSKRGLPRSGAKVGSIFSHSGER